jgi:hypothetical protein
LGRARQRRAHPYFFAGDVAADGLAFAAAAGDEAGVAAVVAAGGLAAFEDAGRNPRFEGSANMLAAKLLTIFASDNATSSKQHSNILALLS